MNLCKSGFVSSRTKSLREKFSRNRSYSELSFKETNTTSSLVSTPTESCSGSLAGDRAPLTSGHSFTPLKKQHAPSADPFFNSDPYCSALDLSAPGGFDEPRFPWQRDVAIQCDLISVPLMWPPPSKKQLREQLQSVKKKTSSSSTSSAASTLINAAAATLRMTGITASDSTGGSNGSNNRFWKSSLLLPSLNVSNATGTSCAEPIDETIDPHSLRRQKSSRWASTVRRPVLKRAASFDSRGGYARLVQSCSSPNSPPEDDFFEAPRSALPILTTTHQQNLSSIPKLPTDYQSHSASHLSSTSTTNYGTGNSGSHGGGGGGFFWNSRSLNSAFRPTALLGASAAMTAAAPFTTSIPKALTESNKITSQNGATMGGGGPISPNLANNQHRRKLSSNEITLKEIRRRQFLVSRKQPSSAPDSFDDESPFSPRDKSSTTNASTSSGENELFNFNTVHRLLNISLSASTNNTDNPVVKPFLLELPDSNAPCQPNLPSPNMQSEIQEINPVLRKLSVLSRAPHKVLTTRHSDSGAKGYLDLDDDYFYDDEEETMSEEPDVAALQKRRRRRALVPPKLITDGYESCTEFDYTKHSKSKSSASGGEQSEVKAEEELAEATLLEKVTTEDVKSVSTSEQTGESSGSGGGGEQKHLMPNVTIEGIECVSPESGDTKESEAKTRLGAGRSGRAHTSTSGSSGSGGSSSNHLGVAQHSRNRRRSSVVVIPPMQICPGDLLVYSKVLSQRSNMIDSFEGTFSSALLNEEHSRKHKNTWSLLRLFDRSTSRNKAAADQILCGLEEVLQNLQPSNSFVDENMLRYRGITWNDFIAQQEERRVSNASSFSATSSLITSASAAAAAAASAAAGIGCSRFFQGARFSSLQSNALDSSANSAPAASSAHVCKKISLPTGGITRAMQQNLERFNKTKTDNNKGKDGQSECLITMTNKPKLQRTESCSTVSDVESINENFEVSPTHRRHDLSKQASAAEEEQSGDRYDSESLCCSCLQITKREQRRREALWELFQSDLLFLTEHLMVLKNVFMEPLKKIQVEGYAMFAEPEVLFGNLDELCLVTYAFCREFLNILLNQTSNSDPQVVTILAKLFQQSGRAAALTQAYHRYTLNYINALNYLETLRRQIEFTEFEKWCNRDSRCKKLQLTDLLVSPVQHVMRVPLILKEIETRTLDPLEKTTILSIIKEQEHSLRELDDKMRWLKNFERLLEIQRNIMWPSVIDMDPKIYVPEFLKALLTKQPCERLIVSPRRQIVLEGALMVLDSGKPVEMYVFLFDDLLLITRRKKGLGKKQSTLTERFVSNCSGRNSSFSSVVSVGAGSGTAGGSGTGSVSTTNSAASAVVNAASATTTAGSSMVGGEPTQGPLCGGGGLFKYVVYKQPLSLDRFYIHDVLPSHEGAANLKHAFVLVCLNRFQQIVTIHTLQAASDSAKNIWLSKLRDTSDRWKRTLQSNVFRNPGNAGGTGGAAGGGSHAQKGENTTNAPQTGTERASSAFGQRLNLNNFQLSTSKSSYQKNKSPPRRGLDAGQDQRLSSGSVSMSSSLRDNASCSYMFDDSIVTTSTFT